MSEMPGIGVPRSQPSGHRKPHAGGGMAENGHCRRVTGARAANRAGPGALTRQE